MKHLLIALIVLVFSLIPKPAQARLAELIYDDSTHTTWVFVNCYDLSLSGWYDPSGILTLVCLSGSSAEFYNPDRIVFVPTEY